MITFITGLPGHGKTLFTLDYVPKEYEGRDVYYYNIENCQMPWKEIDNVKEWYKLPKGAVIIIDEAHKIFHKTNGNERPPAWIENLDMHRHNGHDLILITQHASDTNTFVRKRCGRHIIIVRKFTGSEKADVYTFTKFQEKTDKFFLEQGDHYEFTYPKDLYNKYKSAEVHTVKTHIPKKLYKMSAMVAGCIALAIFAGYNLYSNFKDKQKPVEVVSIDNDSQQQIKTNIKNVMDDYLNIVTARIDGLPQTAPKYDEIQKPKTYPRLQCISSVSRCQCYTQQGTKTNTPVNTCRKIVNDGYFDAGIEDINTNSIYLTIKEKEKDEDKGSQQNNNTE